MRKPAPPTPVQAWFCLFAALVAPTFSIVQTVASNTATNSANKEAREIAIHLRDDQNRLRDERAAGQQQDIRELRQQLAACKPAAPRTP